MSVIKDFLEMIEWEKRHDLYESYLWLILAIPTLIWLRESVLWVLFLSLYANHKTAMGTYKAGLKEEEK